MYNWAPCIVYVAYIRNKLTAASSVASLESQNELSRAKQVLQQGGAQSRAKTSISRQDSDLRHDSNLRQILFETGVTMILFGTLICDKNLI